VIPPIVLIGFLRGLPPMASVAAATVILIALVLAGIYEQRRGYLRTET